MTIKLADVEAAFGNEEEFQKRLRKLGFPPKEFTNGREVFHRIFDYIQGLESPETPVPAMDVMLMLYLLDEVMDYSLSGKKKEIHASLYSLFGKDPGSKA